MDYKKQIDAYFDAKEEDLIAAVTRLCAIRSVKGEAAPGAPFGPGPAAALDEALKLADEMGLTTKNVEGYVGTADLNEKDTVLHILGHLDVVGEGTGWTVCEPYEPKVADGSIYGRGTSDDKGPMVAALMAMQCVKDLNVPLTHNARVILGTDEESGSEDIAYYYSKEPYAPYTFSPDADFPVINIEKGFYRPTFTMAWEPETEGPRVVSFHGGFRLNVVPAEAECVVEGLPMRGLYAVAMKVGQATGVEFRIKHLENDRIQIKALGQGGHAMEPEKSRNAITALLSVLYVCPLKEDLASTRAVRALFELMPPKDTRGAGLGIDQKDELSGELTVAFTMLDMDDRGITGRFDSRVPICANEENCKKVTEASFAKYGYTCTGHMDAPHHTDANSPFVQTLLKCYEQYTGEKGQCLAIGGGTYVHDIPGGVAFGPVMPG
ncbi:MAG: Sapep family Mn(2+)-dependent dipeptidase, partial [Oscillospiraceae bacterium]